MAHSSEREGERTLEEHDQIGASFLQVLTATKTAFYELGADWRCTLAAGRRNLPDEDERVAIGRSIWELLPDEAGGPSRTRSELERAMADRVAVRFTDWYPSLDRSVEIVAYPVEAGLALFFRDVSEEAEARAEAARQLELEHQLVGIVSHDLRDLLNAILIGSNLLVEREGMDETSVRVTRRIKSSAARAAGLVRDLLDFNQGRHNGNLPVVRSSVDLHAASARVLEDLRAAYPGRVIVHEEEGAGVGEWDVDRLEQIVHNLVTNALQYSPVDTPVRVVSRIAAAEATLAVHNAGEPIPDSLRPDLFKAFRRGTSGRARRSGSIGLGLFIVEQIVKAHEGRISVTSSEAEGTTFTVTLPRRTRAAAI